jgi:Fe-S-cluster-containing hydrogenase component 2
LTCELAWAAAFYKNENRQTQNLSCIPITTKQDKIKIQVCAQCGKCAKTCEVQGISKNTKGVYMLNKKTCVGCGKCMEVCPFKVMVKADTRPSPDKGIALWMCCISRRCSTRINRPPTHKGYLPGCMGRNRFKPD